MATVKCYCDAGWKQKGRTGTKVEVFNPMVGSRDDVSGALRGAMRFPLTALPLGKILKVVKLVVYNESPGDTTALWDIQPYANDGQTDPCTQTGTDFWDNCDPKITYINDTDVFRRTGWITIDLGDRACRDIEKAKSDVNRFSLGFHEEGDNDFYARLHTTTPDYKAYLEITYHSFLSIWYKGPWPA